MKCKEELVGEIDGYTVKAVTDMLGPSVVLYNGNVNEIKISPPQKDHEAAVELAKKVLAEGICIAEKWSGPIQSLGDLAVALYFSPVWKQDNAFCH